MAATSITVGSTTNYPTTTGIVIAIRQVDSAGALVAGTYTEWSATVSSATTLTIVAAPVYGTDQVYPAGSTTQVYIPLSSYAHNTLIDGLLSAGLTQAGGMGAITPTSVVASGNVSDNSVTLTQYRVDSTFDYVVSGGVWTADSVGVNLNASMTAIVVWINGQRLSVGAVTARAFTTNVDTYIDILNTAGVGSIVYTTTATNNASPALASNSIRIGIIQAAGTITAATKVNQGQEDKVFPIASSIPYAVTDSLGNLICPRDPNRKLLGYREIISGTPATTGTAATLITGLTCPVIVPTGRKVKVALFLPRTQHTTGAICTVQANIWDGTVGSGTQIGNQAESHDSANILYNHYNVEANTTPATASKTYNGAFQVDGGTEQVGSLAASAQAFIRVELA